KIMVLWMGASFFGEPGLVLSILLIGFIFNGLAQVPFASIQSRGHAKITAFVHLLELFPYLLLLFYLIKAHGVVGAGIAWSVRMIVDYIALSLLDGKYINK
ncbi:TPA: O18ab/O18ac family O-antigen flippase, partial [Escherichia coli]|nr:O18ab/O18ac family O-antigen flippase [Escherichia coli]